VYLLLDENNIVRCMASEECDLHKDKIAGGMRKVTCVNPQGIVGDKYDHEQDIWEAHPENYPQLTETELIEAKIQAKIQENARLQAIKELKEAGEIPADYKGM